MLPSLSSEKVERVGNTIYPTSTKYKSNQKDADHIRTREYYVFPDQIYPA